MWCNMFKEQFLFCLSLSVDFWIVGGRRSISSLTRYIPNPRFFLSEKWSSKPKKKALYDLEVGRPSSPKMAHLLPIKNDYQACGSIISFLFVFLLNIRNRKCNTHNVFLFFCEYMKSSKGGTKLRIKEWRFI